MRRVIASQPDAAQRASPAPSRSSLPSMTRALALVFLIAIMSMSLPRVAARVSVRLTLLAFVLSDCPGSSSPSCSLLMNASTPAAGTRARARGAHRGARPVSRVHLHRVPLRLSAVLLVFQQVRISRQFSRTFALARLRPFLCSVWCHLRLKIIKFNFLLVL